MSADTPDPRSFYAECVPAQFNRTLEDQHARGAAGARLYAGMRAVNATIRVDVEGEGGGTFFLNIREGRMSADDEPTHAPFLTLRQDLRTFRWLVRELEESSRVEIPGVSASGGRLRLTPSRVESLRAVSGLVRFELSGGDGVALCFHFGSEPVPDEPTTTIRMEEGVYRELRSGELDPQWAFMNQQIVVEGDMHAAVQLALAAIASD